MDSLKSKYLVQISDILTDKENGILMYFYQPLIGKEAFSLYHFLQMETKFVNKNFSNQMSFSRLGDFLNLTLEQIKINLQKLTKYNLLKIYFDKSTGKTLNLLKLQKPLSVVKFFANKFFYNEIKQKISITEIETAYGVFKDVEFTTVIDHFSDSDLSEKQSENKMQNKINAIIKMFPNQNFPDFLWTEKEKKMIHFLKEKYQINNDVLLILIDYTLQKSHGLRIGAEYLLSIVEDLNKRQILHHKTKIKTEFEFAIYKLKKKNNFSQLQNNVNPLPNEKAQLIAENNSSMNIKEEKNLNKNFPFLFQN